jgi:hypothetical protein
MVVNICCNQKSNRRVVAAESNLLLLPRGPIFEALTRALSENVHMASGIRLTVAEPAKIALRMPLRIFLVQNNPIISMF